MPKIFTYAGKVTVASDREDARATLCPLTAKPTGLYDLTEALAELIADYPFPRAELVFPYHANGSGALCWSALVPSSSEARRPPNDLTVNVEQLARITELEKQLKDRDREIAILKARLAAAKPSAPSTDKPVPANDKASPPNDPVPKSELAIRYGQYVRAAYEAGLSGNEAARHINKQLPVNLTGMAVARIAFELGLVRPQGAKR